LPVLIYENGPDKGKKIELKDDITYRAGSDARCTIQINDELVAPLHFGIKSVKGIFHLKDAGSPSGTRVNDEQQTQLALQPGDKIQIGATVLSFVVAADKNGFVGKVIGGYQILDHVGRGGMGRVFRALQVSLNREVALKVLSPRLTRDPAFVRKFAEEARAAAVLTHPNVIQVYDVGSEGSIHYYSMEFAEGGTVEERINEGEPIPVQTAIQIIKDAAQGLSYAESKNLVHHDIKPQNLMIDKFNVTKIADMGLAHSLEDSEKIDQGIVGTPHFISPERIKREELDIRSDIYSLGGTFYRILTGKTPFHGSTTREILLKQLKEEPTSIKELRPDVPDRVCQVVEKMMRKNPEERYPGVAPLLEDLEGLAEKKRGKGLLLVTAALVVVTGLALYLLLSGNGQDNSGASETVVIQDDGRSKELQKELQSQEHKVIELEAENALLSVSSAELASEERATRLEELAARYSGTSAGARAGEEAAAIRSEIAAEIEKTAQHERLIASIRTTAENRVSTMVREQRFYEAMAFANSVGIAEGGAAGAEGATDEPEVAAIRDQMIESVSKAAGAFTESLVDTAQNQLSQKEFDAALETVDQGMKVLSAPTSGPDPERTSNSQPAPTAPTTTQPRTFTALIAQRKILEETRRAVESTRRSERLIVLNNDLEVVLDWGDPPREEKSVLTFSFSTLPASPTLASPEYQSYVQRIIDAHEAGSGLVRRLKECVASGTMARDTLQHPTRGEDCTILDLSEDGKGLKLSLSGMSILTLPLSEFHHPEAYINLLLDRYPMDGDDLLDLARSALLVGAAHSSAALTPFREAVQLYGETQEWTDAMRRNASQAHLPPSVFFETLAGIVQMALDRDPTLEDACAELLGTLNHEKAAMDTLRRAVEPFRLQDPSLLFEESVERLEVFSNVYTDTFLFRFTSPFVASSLREGGHLVEFQL